MSHKTPPQKTQTLKIHKAKTDKAEKRNRKITIILGDLSTASKKLMELQEINKDIKALNVMINPQNVADKYKPLYPTTAEYISLSIHRTFFKIFHKVDYRTNKFKSIEIIVCSLIIMDSN